MTRIFHDSSVRACLPIDIKFYDPTVVYSLNNPVKSNIFNFKKFIHNLDVKPFLEDNYTLLCNCEALIL